MAAVNSANCRRWSQRQRPDRSMLTTAFIVVTLSISVASDITTPCGPCSCHDQNVNCSFRNLTSVPQHGLPHNATGFDLSHNRIRDLPDRVFSQFRNLTYLDLSNNLLHNLSIDVFVGLDNLQHLDLSQNDLPLSNESYPPGVFRELSTSLTQLRLEGNCLAGMWNFQSKETGVILNYPDKALSDLTSLESLSVDGLPDVEFGLGFDSLTRLQNLSLSGMGGGYCVVNILRNETLHHLPASLQVLRMANCNISNIEPDAFRTLQNLELLDLSHNPDLGFDTLGEAFFSLQGSSLKELRIGSIVQPYEMFVTVTVHQTRYFKNTVLEAIHAEFNRIQFFCRGALDNMPRTLSYVNVFGNQLSFGAYIQDIHKLANLTYVQGDGRRLASPLPDYYPSREPVECGSGSDDHVTTCSRTWTPGEHGMMARWNQLYYKLLALDVAPNNSLAHLDLSNNILTYWIGPITGLNNLTWLSIENNLAWNVSFTFFQSFPSLVYFNGSRNYLRHAIENDTEGALFETLDKLEVLDLSRNYINYIPENIFRGLVNLINLTLAHNSIFSFNVNMTHMKNFRMLDLSFNYIHYLPQPVIKFLNSLAAEPNVTVLVDLTYNPIGCSCKQIDFLTWIQESDVKLINRTNYYCQKSDSTGEQPVGSFQEVIDELQRTCHDNEGILVGVVSCCFCLMIALLSALAYRFRWKLRYLYYASRLAYRRQHDDEDEQSFEFDAFVSYASEDNDFVRGELIERLETRAGLRLNVHNRDWIPGRPIPSNILAAVQSSRRTLVVLTRHLLDSDWCEYEMQMATMEAVYTGRDVLLFLLYEDVPSHELPRQVLYNIQSSTYIQYPSHDHADTALVDNFWQRLAQAIRD
ncbi:hypothetical protein BaRGS_00025014 [Batillaria attramentaria]|uniref:Toll-like receptor 4 n=1 Tax=Batillaria attramentaria TaxID=370345 RepID=A0ABD0K9P2_9CAEN